MLIYYYILFSIERSQINSYTLHPRYIMIGVFAYHDRNFINRPYTTSGSIVSLYKICNDA